MSSNFNCKSYQSSTGELQRRYQSTLGYIRTPTVGESMKLICYMDTHCATTCDRNLWKRSWFLLDCWMNLGIAARQKFKFRMNLMIVVKTSLEGDYGDLKRRSLWRALPPAVIDFVLAVWGFASSDPYPAGRRKHTTDDTRRVFGCRFEAALLNVYRPEQWVRW